VAAGNRVDAIDHAGEAANHQEWLRIANQGQDIRVVNSQEDHERAGKGRAFKHVRYDALAVDVECAESNEVHGISYEQVAYHQPKNALIKSDLGVGQDFYPLIAATIPRTAPTPAAKPSLMVVDSMPKYGTATPKIARTAILPPTAPFKINAKDVARIALFIL
jgi:hypothetical protein